MRVLILILEQGNNDYNYVCFSDDFYQTQTPYIQ